jgi:hypothetical protein
MSTVCLFPAGPFVTRSARRVDYQPREEVV